MMDPTKPAPSCNTNANVGDGSSAIRVVREISEKEYQARKGKAAESGRCDMEDINTPSTPAVSKEIDGHEPGEVRAFNVSNDQVGTKQYAVELIVGHTQGNGKMRYVVRWCGNTFKEDNIDSAS